MSDSGTVLFSQDRPSHDNMRTLGEGALKVLFKNGTTSAPFFPDADIISEPICQAILYDDIGQS